MMKSITVLSPPIIAKTLVLTGLAASVMLSVSPAQAATLASSFNIDFGSVNPTTNLGANGTFGAAANQAGQWNNITATGATNSLKDTSNTTTSVNLSLTATNITGSNGSASGDLQKLVNDSFTSTNGNNWNVTLSNLSNGVYKVFYYGPSNTGVTTGNFTINGTAVTSITGDNTSSFALGTNYGVLNNVLVSNGTLTFASTSTTGTRGLSGLQISAVPEPLTILGAVTAAGFGAGFKRKLAKSQKNRKDNA